MAEVVVGFVVEETLARILAIVTDEIKLQWGLADELDRLRDSLDEVRDMLQIAEEKQMTLKTVNRWLIQFKDAAYDAEDVLDELAYENLRRKVEKQNQSEREVCSFNPFSKVTSSAKKAAFRTKIVHKVRKVHELLNKIKNASSFGVQVIAGDRIAPQIDLKRVTDSVPENPIIGREADVSKLVNLLTGSCHRQDFTIVPIVGMGGMGKTALAQLVCENVVGKHFDAKIWVCVSSNLDDQKILGEMLQTLNGNKGGLTNKEAIVQQLQQELQNKKFLLVLDDVWEDVSDWWDSLKARLEKICTNNGNAIIVTTRSEDVASLVQSSLHHRHDLNILSDDGCWSIIKERVQHANRGTSIPLELESIGMEIAENCRGVPLAAKVLGGTMSSEMNKETWLSIKDKSVLSASHRKDNVQAILKLSFNYLPSSLKQCFAYCSIFPKDTLIDKEQLIQLWMAEGFLEPCNGDVGNKYFNALLSNSLFQNVERDRLGNIVACKIHYLVHDLAMSFSKSETLTLDSYSSQDGVSCIRRCNLDSQRLVTKLAVLKDGGRKWRTLHIKEIGFDQLLKLENLWTLNLKGAAIEKLPSSVGELKRLRFLDVSQTQVRVLPESITKLYNLQTLRFLECNSLRELPREKMKNLVSLKHIEFSEDNHMPSGLGRLTSLERLPLFVVGSDWGGSIQELEGLRELKGKLTIKNLEQVRSKKEIRKANLQEKKKITALVFQWTFHREECLSDEEVSEEEKGCSDEEVLEELQPHPNIESIKIKNYLGEKFPLWVLLMQVPSENGTLTLLNNLVELTLDGCRYCKQIPSLGNLPCLKFLEIRSMYEVKYIGNEFYGIGTSNEWRLFPALKVFSLSFMLNLVEWTAPEGGDTGTVGEFFPCLEELSISNCDSLRKIAIRNLSSLAKLEIDNCEELTYLFDELHQSFTSLEELSIRSCYNLSSIKEDLRKLTCLISLEILHCRRLCYFSSEILGSLTKLKKLIVGDFSEKLDDFSYLNEIQNLHCLEELTIWAKNYRVKSLPDQLRHLTSLKYLRINCFFEMKGLPEWLGSLSSLQTLYIWDCKNLESLPTATTMKRLSKLKNLSVYACSGDFKESCRKGGGSQWNKISHITNVIFD